MRTRSKKIVLVAVVLAGAAAVIAYLNWDSWRIQYHRAGLQRASRMIDVLAGAVPQTKRDRVTRLLNLPETNSQWVDACSRHETALIRLGYLTTKEFPFAPGVWASDELRTNALPLLSDRTARFSFSQSQAVVTVVARPAEMNAWAKLIGELERRHH